MKTKQLACEPPILELEDLLRDKSIRVIGVVADKNEGKSNLLYNMIKIMQHEAPETNVVGFRLINNVPGVLMLNSLTELAKIHDSYIIVDELKTIVDMESRGEVNELLRLLQTLYHSNNTIVLCGLAHNFNGKVSGEVEAWILKQTTMISVIQRSNLDYILRELSREGKAHKNKYVLTMPKNGAVVYHPYMKKNWHYIEIPYLREFDTKADNKPVIKWIKAG